MKKIILFELKLEQELLELEKQLKNGTYKHGGYTKFKIYEPKDDTFVWLTKIVKGRFSKKRNEGKSHMGI